MTGKEYRTITDVKGPLVFLNKTEPVAFGEIVSLRLADGSIKNGQVLDTSDDLVIVQVFEGTAKIDRTAGVTFMGDVFKLPVSTDLLRMQYCSSTLLTTLLLRESSRHVLL